MKKSFIIAIDGASSTGKSTLAKGLAKELDFVYVDSGAMYRGITLYAQQLGWLTTTHFDKEELIAHLDDIQLTFANNILLLNGKDVSIEIRTMSVSNGVSQVATISAVRAFLVAQQRTIGIKHNVVMDGRDIGTVVFPHADVKLFLTADANIRAQRRFDELKTVDPSATFDAILENITQRDHLDSTRADSPLMQATDAIAINASDYGIRALQKYVLKLVKKRMGS
jgi:cytidylate kinase|tara:strand:- start:10374 stop:11048 length:675 start_codon:yes stop_codon:yes gene_type:complete